MNYLKQLNSLFDIQSLNPISTNELVLYLCLLHINNKLNWKERFNVPNDTLILLSGLPISTMQRARNKLVQKKLIRYYKGSTNKQAPEYKLFPLYEQNSEQNSEQNFEQNSGHIHKQNKTKQNKEKYICIESAMRENVKKVTNFVYLREDEFKKLKLKYGTPVLTKAIKMLDSYKANNPRKTSGEEAYKDDNSALISWAIGKAQEEIARQRINENRLKKSEKELNIIEKKEKYYQNKKSTDSKNKNPDNFSGNYEESFKKYGLDFI